MNKPAIALLLLSASLTACASNGAGVAASLLGIPTTAPKAAPDGFSSASRTSFAVVASGVPRQTSTTRVYAFQKLDTDTGALEREFFHVSFNSSGPFATQEFRAGTPTARRFSGREIEPGAYALMYRTDSNSAPGYGSTSVVCYSRGAFVFEFSPGAVNVVDADDPDNRRGLDLAAIEAETADAVSDRPDISAPIAIAPIIGIVTFETSSWLGRERCAARDGINFTPLPASD